MAMAPSLLQRRLIVVTGKGGVGKTTIAGAVGLLAASQGRRTLILDGSGASSRLRELFGADSHPDEDRPGEPAALAERLWSMSIEPDGALLEWMQELAGRAPARLLATKSSFQYFAAAAPGAKELVTMVKIFRLAGESSPYDLVVLDAPATGHALAMLDSPQTFASIARVGPVAAQAEAVRSMLTDPDRTGYLAVAQAGEMSVTETLELRAALAERIGVELSTVIVNATMHRRFTGEEMSRIESLRGQGPLSAQVRIGHAAAAAAQAAHERTRFQHGQLKRLRQAGLTVLQVPFLFQADLDLPALTRIAERLDGHI